MELLKKAFSILDLFLDNGDELALEDISRLSGLKKATIRRIAITLIECGYLKQVEKRGKYSLGMRFLDFSGIIKKNNGITKVANRHLLNLCYKIDETVLLALWDGAKAVSLCQSYDTNHTLKVVPDEGTRLSMYNTSAGKIILADMTDAELERFVQGKLISTTPNTITDFNTLKSHLAIVKKDGIAIDDEEFAAGVRGLSVPLRIRSGKLVGSIGVIGPSARLSRARLLEIKPIVVACGLDISHELGYRDEFPQ